MKSRSAFAFLTLVTLATATGAFAQQQAIQGNIPFDFSVGDKVLPAGAYTVGPLTNHGMQIKSADGRNWAIVAGSQSYHDASSGSVLEFDRYGDSYFLHRVLCPSLSALNIDLPQGKSERKAKEHEAKILPKKQVLVAMK